MGIHACTEGRHRWQSTTAPGWYRCVEVVDSRLVKRGRSEKLQLFACGAVAYCPGCLGSRLPNHLMVVCEQHVTLDLERVPLRTPAPAPSFSSSMGTPQTLW